MRGICSALLFYAFVILVSLLPGKVSAQQTYTSSYNVCSNTDLCDYKSTNVFGQEIGPSFNKDCGDPGFLCAINPWCKKWTGTDCCTGNSTEGILRYQACRNITDTTGVCRSPASPYRTIQCYNTTPQPPPPSPPAPNCIASDCNGQNCSANGQVCTITTNPCSCVPAPAGCSSNRCDLCNDCGSCTAQSACGWTGSSCQAGTVSCPAGYSQWYWSSCTQNQCATLAPTSAPTPAPAPTSAPPPAATPGPTGPPDLPVILVVNNPRTGITSGHVDSTRSDSTTISAQTGDTLRLIMQAKNRLSERESAIDLVFNLPSQVTLTGQDFGCTPSGSQVICSDLFIDGFSYRERAINVRVNSTASLTIPLGQLIRKGRYTNPTYATSGRRPSNNWLAGSGPTNLASDFFGNFYFDSNSVNVSLPLQPLNDASVCTAISVNSGNAVYTGKNYPATVSIRNAGTSSWTWNQPDPYRLGSQDPQDNNVWGLNRVDLPTSPIGPGSTATFNFNIWAPQSAGTYSFNWQMVHEGIQWFGSRCLYNVNVQNPPFTFTPSCTGTVTNAATKTIRWETSVNPASPPTGSYTYLWSGDASGTTSSVSQTYATAGTKNATVTVTYGGTSQTASCSAVISPPGTPPAPSVSTLLSCLDAGYSGSGLTISWTNPNVSWVDIDTDANFAEAYFHKSVSGTSTTAPNGFGAYPSGGSLSLNPATTYFVRTYNGVQNSQVGSFTTPSSCSASSQPVSPTPAPSSCFGNILLTITPNPTAGLTTLTAASSGLTNCVGIPITVKTPDCLSTQVARCTSGSTGCIANFVAPPAAGSYTYANCIDKPPSDGDYTDAGESDTTILIINPPKSSVNSAWIQTTGGDVHSNTKINTPGGP